MNNNNSSTLSTKFNFRDVIISIASLLVAVILLIVFNLQNNNSSNNKKIQIYYQNQIVETIDFNDINNELIYTLEKSKYPDLFDDFKIKINKEKGVCVDDVDCPNEYCKKQGWVNYVGYPIVCVPNGVTILIVTEGSIDDPFVVG